MNSKEEIEKEAEIIEISKNNPSAFGVIYEKYYTQIYIYVHRRVEDEQVVADLVSQIFYKSLLNLKKYTNKGFPFSSWLYRISVNQINEYYRGNKHNRVIQLTQNHVNTLLDNQLEEQQDPRAKLVEVLQNLETDEIELLELRFFEQKSFKEIGYILSLTEGNARIKTHRLIEKLRLKNKTNDE